MWAMQRNIILNPLRISPIKETQDRKQALPPGTRMVFAAHTAMWGTLHITCLARTRSAAFVDYVETLNSFK